MSTSNSNACSVYKPIKYQMWFTIKGKKNQKVRIAKFTDDVTKFFDFNEAVKLFPKYGILAGEITYPRADNIQRTVWYITFLDDDHEGVASLNRIFNTYNKNDEYNANTRIFLPYIQDMSGKEFKQGDKIEFEEYCVKEIASDKITTYPARPY